MRSPRGNEEPRIIEAEGEAEAWVAEAQGILEAAKKLGNSPLTLELERLRYVSVRVQVTANTASMPLNPFPQHASRRATEILRSADKLIMTRHVNKAQSKREDPKVRHNSNHEPQVPPKTCLTRPCTRTTQYVFEINCNRNDPGGAGGPGKASAMTSPSSHALSARSDT